MANFFKRLGDAIFMRTPAGSLARALEEDEKALEKALKEEEERLLKDKEMDLPAGEEDAVDLTDYQIESFPTPDIKDPSDALDDMVCRVLNSGRNGKPQLGLNPEEVRVLLFDKKADLSHSGQTIWGSSHGLRRDRYLDLKESLPFVCVKKCDQSWAKPVLMDTIKALGASAMSPARAVLPYFVQLWQEKKTPEERLAFYSLLDASLSKMTAKDVSEFIGYEYAEECSPEFFLLLAKHNLVSESLQKKLLEKDVEPKASRWAGQAGPVQCSVLLSPEFLLSRQRERYMELTEDAHAQIELAESPEERNRIVERAGAQYECTLKIFKLISGEDLWAEPEAVKGKTQSRKSGNTLHLMESLEPSATSSDTSSVQVSVNSVNRNNRTGRSRSERGE